MRALDFNSIREELAAIEGDTRSALAHAIAAGEKLIQAKEQKPHGEWLPWLKKEFDLPQKTANNYMRLAANQPRVANLNSVREALKEIAAPPSTCCSRQMRHA